MVVVIVIIKVILWCILSYLNRVSLWEKYPLMLINMSLWTILEKKIPEFFINLLENYFFIQNFDVLQDLKIMWWSSSLDIFLCRNQIYRQAVHWLLLTLSDGMVWSNYLNLLPRIMQFQSESSHFSPKLNPYSISIQDG